MPQRITSKRQTSTVLPGNDPSHTENVGYRHFILQPTYSGSLYGFLTADTLIGENIENGVYTYTPSVIAKDILINDGVQIRLSGTQGLRFILTLLMNRDGAENLFTDFGAVVIPTAMAEGENTTLSTDRVGVVSKKTLDEDFRYFTLSDSSVSYTACIIGTPPAKYDRFSPFGRMPFTSKTKSNIRFTANMTCGTIFRSWTSQRRFRRIPHARKI